MIVSNKGKRLQLPDFLIPGAARSGTTKLFDSLSRHPSLFFPEQKEPTFFSLWKRPFPKEWKGESGLIPTDWQCNTLDDYLNLFNKAKPGQLLGEGSVWYLYDHATAIANILELYGAAARDLKILIMLRNPITRAWSHYLLKTAFQREPLSFEEAISETTITRRLADNMNYTYDYIGFGRYAEQINAWTQAFPRCRVWIFEEFFQNLPKHMKQIADFLEIPMDPVLLSKRKINPSGRLRGSAAQWIAHGILKPSRWKSALKKVLPYPVRRKMKLKMWKRLTRPEPMPDSFRRNLTEIYNPEIDRLEELLGRSLSIWRGSV
ncbi:MAG: sulfotransferase [Acidobacteria bacterium]|nr:sulfotransferase [Acidobacteriota bacterium]